LLNFKLFLIKWLSHLRQRLIGRFVVGVMCDTKNGLLMIGSQDLIVGRRLAYKGAYGSDAVSDLKSIIRHDDSMCIVGAHVGSLLVPLANSVQSIVAYEANPQTFKMLEMNIALNALKNVTSYNVAVGDKIGQVEFYLNTVNSGGSKIKPPHDFYKYTYDRAQQISVPMVSLDEHAADTEFNVIIMDIEGAEYRALLGMQKKLQTCRCLQLEYVSHSMKNIARVSNAEFLSAFDKHFSYAFVVGHQQQRYDRADFVKMLNDLQRSKQHRDVIFLK